MCATTMMTPTELKATRRGFGLSAAKFARLLRIGDGRTVRRWEAGECDIPGPVTVIVELLQKSSQARRLLLSPGAQ